MIYNLDYRDFLEQIPDQSVDAIISDIPYGIDYTAWDIKINYMYLFLKSRRIIKPRGNIIFFMGWSNVVQFIQGSDGLHLIDWIVYDRIKGRGAKNKLMSTREDILHFNQYRQGYTFNKQRSTIVKKTKGMGRKNGTEYRALSNVWTDISPIVPWSKERVDHPTQKPLKLMERLVLLYTNENDLIVDPFAGSGTTAVAAQNNGRRFIINDINEEYIRIAKERIERSKC